MKLEGSNETGIHFISRVALGAQILEQQSQMKLHSNLKSILNQRKWLESQMYAICFIKMQKIEKSDNEIESIQKCQILENEQILGTKAPRELIINL